MSSLGKRLIAAAKEANAIAKGEAAPDTYRVHVPEKIDVKAVRKATGLSQGSFAARFAIPAATLRDWEQKRREPDSTTRAYLTVIQRAHSLVAQLLAAAPLNARQMSEALAKQPGVRPSRRPHKRRRKAAAPKRANRAAESRSRA